MKLATIIDQLKSATIFSLVFLVFMGCNKEMQTTTQPDDTEVQLHHGYLYIGCATPPYFMNFDSLITHCSVEGPLPESFPAFTLNSDTTQQFCRFDGNEAWIGTETNQDVSMTFGNLGLMDIESAWPEVVSEVIPITIESTDYQPGEGSYLGGYRFTVEDKEASVQVVNAYVGGCFHNVVIWSYEN